MTVLALIDGVLAKRGETGGRFADAGVSVGDAVGLLQVLQHTDAEASPRMTTILHPPAGASSFDLRRQQAEIRSVIESRAASTYLAEGYTGWPGWRTT